MKHKLLSILLCLAMALSLLPTAALADEGNVAEVNSTGYSTLADAINAAGTGATVKLLADINTPETTYKITKSLTIDLNGKTVTGSGYDSVFEVTGENINVVLNATDGGKVIAVENSGSAGKYAMAVWMCGAGSTLTINGGEFSQSITSTSDPQMDMIYTSAGKIIINSGTFKSGTPKWTLNIKDGAYKDGSANIIVNGGTFVGYDPRNAENEGKGTSLVAEGVGVDANSDGTFTAKSGMVAQIIDAKGNSKKACETLQEAIDAAGRKTTVKLLVDTKENVTISTPDVTLDLNGHTLNGGTVEGKPALTITARVTVMDSSAAQTGTIMREDTADNSGVSSHYVIDVQDAGWLTFESGNVTNNSGNTAGKGASLVRVGDDSVAKYPGLNIKGGTFTQNNFIVIKVDSGNLFLNGGTLNSTDSYAIEDWHRATIKGGTVNGTVAAWTYSGGHNSTLDISGGTVNGDVISVNYGSTEGKVAKVSITGGTVNGTLGTYTYSNGLTATEDTSKATIGITGGTFKNDPSKYVVEGSTATQNDDGTFGVTKAYLARIGETFYYTMEDAFEAQTDGDTIVLLRDYTTGSTFNSGSINRTVDLNGHTWTCTGTDANSAAFEINYADASLTVKNGKIVSSQLVGLIPSAMGGTIKYDNSSLTFENVEMSTTATSGIETNGNNTNDSVTLKNSTLNVPKGFGIYFPSSGTLTIDNSTINAKTMGVQVCAGSLNINAGSTITVSGDSVEKIENDGAIQDGAAISIVNRIGYKGLGKIAVTGGTFTAKSGNAAIKAYNWENQTESDFNASDKVSVSGGTFSSAVKAEYCAPGFVPKANSDGTYGVTRPSSGSSGSYDPTYSVSTPSKTEHGTVTVSPKNASKGDRVTVTVKPDSGYVLETLTVTDKNGNELTLKDKGNGKYTFTMPAGKVEVKATFMEDNSMLNFFYDVPNNAYFYEAVKWAVKNGITTGVGNNLFAPEQPCTRAQIVTFLWRAAGSPEPKGAASGMTDVVSGSYYEKAVAWAIENGITTGTTTSTFSPDATCTRAQAVTFLARALKAKAASAAEFSDVPTGSYFADAVAWAAANGVTEGIGGGLFGSDNDCTRGQIVTFLYRAYNK